MEIIPELVRKTAQCIETRAEEDEVKVLSYCTFCGVRFREVTLCFVEYPSGPRARCSAAVYRSVISFLLCGSRMI